MHSLLRGVNRIFDPQTLASFTAIAPAAGMKTLASVHIMWVLDWGLEYMVEFVLKRKGDGGCEGER